MAAIDFVQRTRTSPGPTGPRAGHPKRRRSPGRLWGRSLRRLAGTLVLVGGALLAGAAPGQDLDTLSDGWNAIPTDGKCSSGTPYQFFVRRGRANRLLVFFNGGGACWGGQQCDLAAQPVTHYPFADMDKNKPAHFGGIFALDNPKNPIADYSMVVLPYCTGDVHVGSGPKNYSYQNAQGKTVELTVFHDGFSNATAVLDWVYRQFPAPERILVSGVSAGAIGSSFHAGRIAEHYGDTPVVLIADSAGGYNSVRLPVTMRAWDVASILPDWPEYAGETNDSLTFEDFYIASANHAPNLTIAQINTARDETQRQFSLLLGDAPDSFTILSRELNNFVEIESAVDSLSTYTAAGDRHVLIMGPSFYRTRVQGTVLRDWFADLAEGRKVPDRSCVDEDAGCARAR